MSFRNLLYQTELVILSIFYACLLFALFLHTTNIAEFPFKTLPLFFSYLVYVLFVVGNVLCIIIIPLGLWDTFRYRAKYAKIALILAIIQLLLAFPELFLAYGLS